MIKKYRRLSVRDADLTQEEAAGLLETTRVSIGRQERGDNARGPLTGALEYLIASWPLLTNEQRKSVRERLAIFRCS